MLLCLSSIKKHSIYYYMVLRCIILIWKYAILIWFTLFKLLPVYFGQLIDPALDYRWFSRVFPVPAGNFLFSHHFLLPEVSISYSVELWFIFLSKVHTRERNIDDFPVPILISNFPSRKHYHYICVYNTILQMLCPIWLG